MSYDASNAYDPKQALLAYRSLFAGQILLGLEIPPEVRCSSVWVCGASRDGSAAAAAARSGGTWWQGRLEVAAAISRCQCGRPPADALPYPAAGLGRPCSHAPGGG